jgi:competence ComEA-like helix-hairpin-helix protein
MTPEGIASASRSSNGAWLLAIVASGTYAPARMRLPHKFAWSSSAMGWCVPAFLLCCGPMLAATKKLPLRPLNLNTATAFELQQVPGIGPSTADKILKMRKSYEAFKSLADLPAIEGFGPKRK